MIALCWKNLACAKMLNIFVNYKIRNCLTSFNTEYRMEEFCMDSLQKLALFILFSAFPYSFWMF